MSDPSMAKRKKGASGCSKAILSLIVLVVIGTSLVWVWKIQSEKRFERQLKELSDRGEPVSAADLEAFYCLRDGDVDTTELWDAATKGFGSDAFNAEMKPLPIVGWATDPIPLAGEKWERLEEIEEILARYQGRFELMHSATEKGGAARFPINLDPIQDRQDRLNNKDPYWQRIQEAAKLLYLESRVHAHREKPAEVLRSVDTLLHFGESLERAPTYRFQRIRCGFYGFAVGATADALGDVDFNDEQLRALQDKFRSVDLDDGIQRALLGDRCLGIKYLRDPDQGVVYALVGHDTTTFLEESKIATLACEKSYSEAMAELELQRQRVERLNSIRNQLTLSVTSTFKVYPQLKAECQASLRMADLGIAIVRFRLANGKLPVSNDDCVPDFIPSLPKDPFDGMSIRYLPDPGGVAFTLYCVGDNQKDDGGPDFFVAVIGGTQPASHEDDQIFHVFGPGSVRPGELDWNKLDALGHPKPSEDDANVDKTDDGDDQYGDE